MRLSLRPGSDLMAKAITRNTSVIKIITSSLVNKTDDYIVGDSEWPNGCRSDLVLEPKSSSIGLPPIIIEFQQSVDYPFLKRVIQYSLQAYQRYKIDPIILIICMNNLSSDIEQSIKRSNIIGCQSYPCHGWADKCLIMSKNILNTLTPSENADPFVAFGLFLTQSTPITDIPCDDATMNHLKNLAFDHYTSLIGNQIHLVDFVKDLLNSQEKQYKDLLDLTSQENSSNEIQQSIKNAHVKQQELKRKFDELDDINLTPATTSVPFNTASAASPSPNASSSSSSSTAPPSPNTSSSSSTASPSPSPSPNNASSSISPYQKGMMFVSQFKADRIKQGKERMDWKACIKEGQQKGLLLNYKNINTLKNQFVKFEKSQTKK
ncbi:hypothetical protein INT45_008410 [Circinella minor]|uniref:Uncharacterized protein n=1 Tax=Circinella minor TaxID=1195481 RepID=A0A8H7VI49_9FUNG|nr:hypothetical protein INT45_008410 [Circinella minor]